MGAGHRGRAHESALYGPPAWAAGKDASGTGETAHPHPTKVLAWGFQQVYAHAMRWVAIIAVLVVLTGQARADENARALGKAESLRREVLGDLAGRFDRLLADRDGYVKRVERECRGFPEGDLFPYLFPVLAYASMIADGFERADERVETMAWLLEQARGSVERKVKPPKGKLVNLGHYSGQAVYLCQYNLGLGAFFLATGDKRFDLLHKRLTNLIFRALKEVRGQPLESFPGVVYPFDTIPCLLSLEFYDKVQGTSGHRPYIEEHFHWILAKGTDAGTHLPASKVDAGTFEPTALPRGCDLSFRVALLALIERSAAMRVYKPYVKHFWKELFVAAGFAEWPAGHVGRQDNDSGPIVMGLGMAASGFGLAATRLTRDGPRFLRLMQQLATVRGMVEAMGRRAGAGNQVTIGDRIPVLPDYYTGFLFGDCALFFALSWSVLSPPGGTTPHSHGHPHGEP